MPHTKVSFAPGDVVQVEPRSSWYRHSNGKDVIICEMSSDGESYSTNIGAWIPSSHLIFVSDATPETFAQAVAAMNGEEDDDEYDED